MNEQRTEGRYEKNKKTWRKRKERKTKEYERMKMEQKKWGNKWVNKQGSDIKKS